jgi:hypothetical protein
VGGRRGDVDLGEFGRVRTVDLGWVSWPNWCFRRGSRGEWRCVVFFISKVWRRERPMLWEKADFVEAAEVSVSRY